MSAKDFLASVAYREGREAGLQHISQGLNKYPVGSTEHEQWKQGNLAGQAERYRREGRAA